MTMPGQVTNVLSFTQHNDMPVLAEVNQPQSISNKMISGTFSDIKRVGFLFPPLSAVVNWPDDESISLGSILIIWQTRAQHARLGLGFFRLARTLAE